MMASSARLHSAGRCAALLLAVAAAIVAAVGRTGAQAQAPRAAGADVMCCPSAATSICSRSTA